MEYVSPFSPPVIFLVLLHIVLVGKQGDKEGEAVLFCCEETVDKYELCQGLGTEVFCLITLGVLMGGISRNLQTHTFPQCHFHVFCFFFSPLSNSVLPPLVSLSFPFTFLFRLLSVVLSSFSCDYSSYLSLSPMGQPASGSLRDGGIGGNRGVSVGVIYGTLTRGGIQMDGQKEEEGERDGERL